MRRSISPLRIRGFLEQSPADADTYVPPYKAGRFGNWRGEWQKNVSPIIRGYFAPLQAFGSNFALSRNGQTWMSTTPMERESQWRHVLAARGHVVIAGLGMGWLVANAARKPEVTAVTVLERDPEVIALFPKILPRYAGMEKVKIVNTDALAWKTSQVVDLLAADIWLTLGDPDALGHVKVMHANTNARAVAWWGMELDFVDWLRNHGHAGPAFLSLDDYRMFAEKIGLPLIEQDNEEYPHLAWSAAENVVLY